MSWKVTRVDAHGNAALTQTMERLRFTMDTGFAGTVKFDSRENEQPIGKSAGVKVLAPILTALVGAQFTSTVSPRGEVSDFVVPENIRTILQRTPSLDATFPPGAFEQLVQLGVVLPNTPVRNGDHWSHKGEMPFAGSNAAMSIDTRATYHGPADRDGREFATITLKPTAALINAPAKVFGSFTLKRQEGDGHIVFDHVRGRLVESSVKQTLHMENTPPAGAEPVVVTRVISLRAKLVSPN